VAGSDEDVLGESSANLTLPDYGRVARDAGGIFETVSLNSLEANGDFASGRILSEFQRIWIVVAKRNTITREA
jgi:hypothetical protein